MTTKVTVFAGHGWPVAVRSTNGQVVIVPPNTTQEFNIWDGNSITVEELPPVETTIAEPIFLGKAS